MTKVRVLLAGETWSSVSLHTKGFDTFTSAVRGDGAVAFIKALQVVADVDHLAGDRVPLEFPLTLKELARYQVVVLSDIGADSLLLHPDTWERGMRKPNRLSLLEAYVTAGGGLAMCGGYLSFQGWFGRGRYSGSAVERALPVRMEKGDDRVEVPEGVRPRAVSIHPVTAGIVGPWPHLLGYNRLTVAPSGKVLAMIGDDALLVVGSHGRGRSLAWASDVGPHWCPPAFVRWQGYGQMWRQAVEWLAGIGQN